MRDLIPAFMGKIPRGRLDSRGITGLETAIVLIAFVVVSSVFAFSTLTMGLFASDRSEETLRAGLGGARGTLELKGSVIAEAITTGDQGGTTGDVTEITFQVGNAAGGAPINLLEGETILKYSDDNQSFLFDTASEFTVTGVGNADNDKLVERGEIYEIALTNISDRLTTTLSTSDRFTIEVLVQKGAVLSIERTTPVYLEQFNDLG